MGQVRRSKIPRSQCSTYVRNYLALAIRLRYIAIRLIGVAMCNLPFGNEPGE